MSIHSRDAAKDTLDIMKEYGKDLGGVDPLLFLFCGNGPGICETWATISALAGVVTFKNAKADPRQWWQIYRWSGSLWRRTVRIWRRCRTGAKRNSSLKSALG